MTGLRALSRFLFLVFLISLINLPLNRLPLESDTARAAFVITSGFSPNVITRANTREKVVALTFDDGPDPRFTPLILDTLKEYNIKATFFVVGEQAFLNPDLVQRAVNEGHEIENHSYTHPDLRASTDLTTGEEILWCHRLVHGLSGREPLYFRPPRRLFNNDIVATAHIYGYAIVLWSVCMENRMARTPEAMARRVVKACFPGAIILAHDGYLDRSKTVKALPLLIKDLQKQGYRFVTLETLLTKYHKPSRFNIHSPGGGIPFF